MSVWHRLCYRVASMSELKDIKGLRPSLNIQDLTSSMKTLRAYARIDDADLIADIKSICDAMNRVGTPKSLALSHIADGALRDALAINGAHGRAERSQDLKDLAVWLGSVKMGWV